MLINELAQTIFKYFPAFLESVHCRGFSEQDSQDAKLILAAFDAYITDMKNDGRMHEYQKASEFLEVLILEGDELVQALLTPHIRRSTYYSKPKRKIATGFYDPELDGEFVLTQPIDNCIQIPYGIYLHQSLI